jgi:hypothetical protein
MLTKVWYKR